MRSATTTSVYHERRDETRNVGLGPQHDWSSNAADAFGYMAISYEEPKPTVVRRPSLPPGASVWGCVRRPRRSGLSNARAPEPSGSATVASQPTVAKQ